jgi:predicted DNA binding CopG/RHH family protein
MSTLENICDMYRFSGLIGMMAIERNASSTGLLWKRSKRFSTRNACMSPLISNTLSRNNDYSQSGDVLATDGPWLSCSHSAGKMMHVSFVPSPLDICMNERQRNMTKKSIPTLTSDEEAEAFLDQDLTDYLDLDTFTEVRFEFLPKTKKVNLRVPEALLEAVRQQAKQEGISYQKYIRRAVEKSLVADRQHPD